MGNKYKILRQQLDELGYKQTLVPEAVPLVEKLVADLIQTTESLGKYMKIAKSAVEERDNLELGAEPYKCDNAKLVRECNELHSTFLKYREKKEAAQKDLKREIEELQKQLLECEKQKRNLKEKVKDLEYAAVISKNKKFGAGSRSTSTITEKKPVKPSSVRGLEGAMSAANQKITNLTAEIKKLKDEKIELLERCECYKKQINSRDREIERLSFLLEGGRPLQAVNNDCCYKDSQGRVCRLQDEVNLLKKEKSNLETCLKEAVAKQHEAMKRALHLADRNRELEKELRDIDQMALAVEAEANSTAKTNAEKVSKLQEKIHDALLQIQSLEKQINHLRREKQELMADWESTKMEKKHLQSLLETALEEKKLTTDRINQFTVIEDDLNVEIDRLMQLSAEQKQKIAELECRILSKDLDDEHSPVLTKNKKPKKKSSPTRAKSPTKTNAKSSPSKRSAGKKQMEKQDVSKEQPIASMARSRMSDSNREAVDDAYSNKNVATTTGMQHEICRCCNSNNCMERMKLLLDRDLEQRQLQMCLINLDNMRGEKEHYMKEYHRLLEQISGKSDRTDDAEAELRRQLIEREHSLHSLQRELNQKMNEKDQMIMNLQRENKVLAEEKFSLMSRLETVRDRTDTDLEAMSLKSVIKRLEREKELLKVSIQELEEEKDRLKRQLKEITESKRTESSRLERAVRDSEQQLRTLEREKQELMQNQGSRKASLDHLQGQLESLKGQLHSSQSELAKQKNLYNQLKVLQEQSDRAVSESQSRIRQLETELSDANSKLGSVHSFREEQGQMVHNLKQDINTLKKNLTQLEKEKDDILNSLDARTEKIAKLEKEIKQKNNYIAELEANVKDLKQQLGLMADSTSTKEYRLKATSAENVNLRAELEAALKAKENALSENRRIQEELASCIAEGRRVHKDLEIAKRQIEDLKTQLQHYVAEVKRTEDLISQKEIERNEILDQFRTLSGEAALLENSNHSLVNEATQSKVQLSVALEHASELEKKLSNHEATVHAYEKQIGELTSQVASLEIELKRQTSKNDKLEGELRSVQELCAKLDQQNDNISRQLSDRTEMKTEMERLRRDSDAIRDNLQKDRNNVEYLEKLLNESRQEAVNVKLLNQELQSEIQRLKSKAEDLHGKLIQTSEQLELFQEKALEYSQQNKQLRREIANERFFRAREDENKRYPSL